MLASHSFVDDPTRADVEAPQCWDTVLQDVLGGWGDDDPDGHAGGDVLDRAHAGRLDHLGRPSGVTSPAERWANLPEVLALAKYPNVAMKATGAPSYSDQPYPFRDIHDNLRRLYDAFGPTRWFWGTDITRMPCSWRQCVTLFTEELPWLRGRDLELVMGRAVCDWLGWKR